ncbi:hypothetical protein ACP4OV_024961 [Aristida adscensionis]
MSPLSELVWSPDEGLSIKIAASSLSTRKASLRWNADTLSIVISSPQQSGAAGKSGDNIDANLGVLEKMPSHLQTRSDNSVRVTMASPNRTANLDVLQSTSMRSQEPDSKCCEGINAMNEGEEGFGNCCVDKPEEMEVGSCPTRCWKDTCHGSTPRKEAMPSISEKQVYCPTTVRDERSWATNAWRARLLKAISQKNSILPKNAENTLAPSSSWYLYDTGKVPGKSAGFLGNGNAQCLGNDSRVISSTPEFHSHDNCQDQILQESHKDEHLVVRDESASGINALAVCESASRFNARKLEKGKEKVVYNNSNCVSNTKKSDDSNESIESCPSTKVPKRKYAECSAVEIPSGNKRCRREDNESSCSGLLQKCGSSFFNWMSSLTKGLIMLDEPTPAVPLDQKFSETTGKESAAVPLPHQNCSSIPLQSVGFNSLFQSLYSHNIMITSRNNYHQPESICTGHVPIRLTLDLKGGNSMLDKQIDMGRENLDVATDNPIDIFPMRAKGNFKLSSTSRPLEEKQNEYTAGCSNAAIGNNGGFAESLWVSRFLPKTIMKSTEATPCNVENDFCAVNPKGTSGKLCCPSLPDFNVEKDLSNIQQFTGKGISDEETSSKCPAVPPEEPKQSETMASVFAKRLDALRYAKTSAVRLAITCDRRMHKRSVKRTNSFLVSYGSHDELEVEQESHKSSNGNGRMVLWTTDKGKEQLCTQSNEELRRNFSSEREHEHHGGSSKDVAPQDNIEENTLAEHIDGRRVEIKERVSDSMVNLPDNKQVIPYGIMSNDVSDELSSVSGALHRLRLSRSDIIRWLRSPIMHTTLDGFFVRLRFGRWEEALGGTGYHVARLNGALDRNRLSVTIRNSTCQVDSRFVSNHDFHEDELKAWWSAATNGDWKLPSKEELNMKLRERELFHS